MEIEHILEKGSGAVNEDALVVGKNLFGVFDGATSLDKTMFEDRKTGGLIASSIACTIFSKNCYPLKQLARRANNAIHDKMISCGVDSSERDRLWSTSAAVVRIKDNGIEWVQTGDSYVILIYKDNSYKVLAKNHDHDFETLSRWKKIANKSQVTISEALKEQIRKTRKEMNRTYGVLNGEKEAEHFLQSGFEPLANVKEILLFTDGLQVPSAFPEKNKNFDTLVDLYLTLGLTGLKNQIRTIEQEDPQCKTFPRFKCHDDIAAISIHP